MKSQIVLLLGLTLLVTAFSQKAAFIEPIREEPVYEPFSTEEIEEVVEIQEGPVVDPIVPEDRSDRYRHRRPDRGEYPKRQHEMRGSSFDNSDEEFYGDLTEEEKEERRQERRRYNHMFKWGMLIGTGVLACILCKFCAAKRRRCRAMRQQMRPQHMQMQEPHVVQPYGYPMNQPAYPTYQQQPYGAQPQVQMGRPPRHMQQPYAQPQERQQAAPAPQIRGRPHESCMMREAPAQNQYVEAQIRFHEAELMRLKNMVRREEPQMQQMRREVPINTCESIETNQPLRRRPIPVGQPLYEKDANSSFASEYPEI